MALTVLFALMLLTSAVLAVALGNRIAVVRDIRAGELGDVVNRAHDADDFVSGAATVFALNQLAIVVVFIIWLYRAAKNNEGLRRSKPRFSAGWSIGAWFIPLANLVIPVLIVQDLWRGADSSRPRGDPDWRRAPGSVLVGLWWAAALLSVIRFAASGSGFDNGTLADIERSNTIALIGVVFTGIAAVLGLWVVRALTRRQLDCLIAQRAEWESARSTPR